MPAAARRQVAEIGKRARKRHHLGVGAVVGREVVGAVILLEPGDKPVGGADRSRDARQLQVAVRYMQGDDAAGFEPRQIAGERLAREQMHRDRIGGEGVEHDQVVALRRRRQREPPVAGHDFRVRRAGREEAEALRIARDADHFRIDLEERPVLAVAPVAGEAPGAEPDGRDLAEAAARGARRLDRLRDRTAEIEIGERYRSSGDRAGGVTHALGAVQRGAVEQQAMRAVDRLQHLVHAEEAACGLDLLEARLPEPGHYEGEHDKAEEAGMPLRLSSISAAIATSTTWRASSPSNGSRTSSIKAPARRPPPR